jgi:protein-tyrosine-phosphatase
MPLHRLFSRILGLVGITLLALTSQPALASDRPKILLVCQFGTVKSAITRELLIRRASERGIALTAWSRGITPGEHLAPTLKVRLDAERIDPRRQPLRRLSTRDIAKADIVVAFDPLPASFARAKVQDWSDTPSMNSSYDAARRVVDLRIDALLDQLQRKR